MRTTLNAWTFKPAVRQLKTCTLVMICVQACNGDLQGHLWMCWRHLQCMPTHIANRIRQAAAWCTVSSREAWAHWQLDWNSDALLASLNMPSSDASVCYTCCYWMLVSILTGPGASVKKFLKHQNGWKHISLQLLLCLSFSHSSHAFLFKHQVICSTHCYHHWLRT